MALLLGVMVSLSQEEPQRVLVIVLPIKSYLFLTFDLLVELVDLSEPIDRATQKLSIEKSGSCSKVIQVQWSR